jgi:hypothetical protein
MPSRPPLSSAGAGEADVRACGNFTAINPLRPDRPLGYGDVATALKTAEPEHRFSPTDKREVQLGPNPARRGELLRN